MSVTSVLTPNSIYPAFTCCKHCALHGVVLTAMWLRNSRCPWRRKLAHRLFKSTEPLPGIACLTPEPFLSILAGDPVTPALFPRNGMYTNLHEAESPAGFIGK